MAGFAGKINLGSNVKDSLSTQNMITTISNKSSSYIAGFIGSCGRSFTFSFSESSKNCIISQSYTSLYCGKFFNYFFHVNINLSGGLIGYSTYTSDFSNVLSRENYFLLNVSSNAYLGGIAGYLSRSSNFSDCKSIQNNQTIANSTFAHNAGIISYLISSANFSNCETTQSTIYSNSIDSSLVAGLT